MPRRGDPIGFLTGDIEVAQADRAGRRRQKSGDDVEECRLAGAVRADHAEDLAGPQVEVVVGQRLQAPEAAADIVCLENDAARGVAHAAPRGLPFVRRMDDPARPIPAVIPLPSGPHRNLAGGATQGGPSVSQTRAFGVNICGRRRISGRA